MHQHGWHVAKHNTLRRIGRYVGTGWLKEQNDFDNMLLCRKIRKQVFRSLTLSKASILGSGFKLFVRRPEEYETIFS